ncbi:MAG TPA: TetR/AcrR family transcriptional regulator [Actinophytocola sp.]|uniref:TetR/AcrR family transcriptional regulator n=1 Tax=Actinophytocola sp. TaxID=1872138 RepID=UPI002DDCDAEC|nr:TetR/AcrR family transcriptional regulator [Actinophytocola sp.]HEV2781706.1 TetR/AcrR family transcriptional regulator [Actinophytocola sp.]
MAVKRHTVASPSRVDDDVLLDAARACVLDTGVRRTTLSSVARAAGVSRMTLYRHFPDVRSLLAALMTREFGALLARVDDTSGGSARQRVVAATVDSVCALVVDPLLRAVLDRDAELMLPYLVERIGGVQRIAEEFLRAQLIAGHQDGSVRRADPAAQARAIFLVAQSFVFSMRPATADVDRAALIGELTRLVEGALRP